MNCLITCFRYLVQPDRRQCHICQPHFGRAWVNREARKPQPWKVPANFLTAYFIMSFGFAVGDFIAVGNLIKDISSCLQDTGGAKAEYQGLLRELECLQQALEHLDKLQNSSSSPYTNLDSIKYAALSCRRPLEQFLGKIQKYDKSLGVWGKEGVIKSTVDKLRWGFGQKEDIRKLQSYLNIHIGTINILLAEHGLEKMDLASDKAVAHQFHIRERLEITYNVIKTISGNLAMQILIVENTQDMLARLFEMISGEFRTSWRSLGDMVAKVLWVSSPTYDTEISFDKHTMSLLSNTTL